MKKAKTENKYHYNPRLQPLARHLRNNGTKAVFNRIEDVAMIIAEWIEENAPLEG
jgi:biotin synthase-related radical SAM superfamily protein